MSDYPIIKDQTINMLTIEELTTKDPDLILYNLKTYYNYYFKHEILEIVDLLCSKNQTYNLTKWLSEQNKLTTQIRDKLYSDLINQSLFYGHKAFIEYCNPDASELNYICDFQDNIEKMYNFISILDSVNKLEAGEIVNKAVNMLSLYDTTIIDKLPDKFDDKTIYYRVSLYAKKIYDLLNKKLITTSNIDLFALIIKDIDIDRHSKYKYVNIKNDLNSVMSILQETLEQSTFTDIQKDEIFKELCNTTLTIRRNMFEYSSKYNLTEIQINSLFDKIILEEEDVAYILKNIKLYSLQLGKIVRALPSFININYKNDCIDIISKNYRSEVLKNADISIIFDELLQN
jgi:hypothetical protein